MYSKYSFTNLKSRVVLCTFLKGMYLFHEYFRPPIFDGSPLLLGSAEPEKTKCQSRKSKILNQGHILCG